MANVLKKDKQLQIVHLLVEGASIRSIERLTGVQKKTILRLLVRVGNACQELLDERLRDLTLRHVQLDEIHTFVRRKQHRIPVYEQSAIEGDQFLFLAMDQDTKLIACYALGKRTAELTRRFCMDLAGRFRWPSVVSSDARNFRDSTYPVVTRISTDGWPAYPAAVDAAFGAYAKHGVIIKDFRNANMLYHPSEIVGSKRTGIRGISTRREIRSICTSHIERQNLTIRTFIKRFNRLTLAFSKKLENLNAAVALHIAHYNFCRVHGTLRKTPAMAADITNDIWTLEELVDKATGVTP